MAVSAGLPQYQQVLAVSPAPSVILGSYSQAWMSQGGSTAVDDEETRLGKPGGDGNWGLSVSFLFVHSHGQGSPGGAQGLLLSQVSL